MCARPFIKHIDQQIVGEAALGLPVVYISYAETLCRGEFRSPDGFDDVGIAPTFCHSPKKSRSKCSGFEFTAYLHERRSYPE